jgi:hypothetical protein
MTFAEVLEWCKKQRADVRGISRGRDIAISHKASALPPRLPSISEIFHWDLEIGDWSHYTSGSDMERMVTGQMTIDEFKSTLRPGE